MKHFLDILRENYNFNDEIDRIAKLFVSQTLYIYSFNTTWYTLEEVFEKHVLSKWKGRLSCISMTDLKNSLHIRYSATHRPISNSDDDILRYLEYYINVMLNFTKSNRSNEYSKTEDFHMLNENMLMLLDHMNHEVIEDKDNQIFLVVPKNPQGTAAAEVSSKSTGLAILQYHHRLLKGNLDAKSKILFAIAGEYEDMLKNPPTGYKELFDKTRGLCNQLCIRHTNKQNKCNIGNLSDEELEHWYDEIYQMLLLCILISENIKQQRVEKAKQLLDSFNNTAN